MAVMEVRVIGDDVLRQVAEPVRKVNEEIKNLIKDMFETMHAAQGVGLAAPQVGISKRVIVIDTGEHTPIALVNPVLVRGWKEVELSEGCLSVPGVSMNVARYDKVLVKGRNEKDRQVTIEATGLLAQALQHEIDHLDGKIFVDLVDDKVALEKELADMRRRLAEEKLAGAQAETEEQKAGVTIRA